MGCGSTTTLESERRVSWVVSGCVGIERVGASGGKSLVRSPGSTDLPLLILAGIPLDVLALRGKSKAEL